MGGWLCIRDTTCGEVLWTHNHSAPPHAHSDKLCLLAVCACTVHAYTRVPVLFVHQHTYTQYHNSTCVQPSGSVCMYVYFMCTNSCCAGCTSVVLFYTPRHNSSATYTHTYTHTYVSSHTLYMLHVRMWAPGICKV